MPARRGIVGLAVVVATITLLALPAGAATADVGVSVADAPDPVTVGSDLHYVVTATNQGPGDATGVSIDDTLPSGVSLRTSCSSRLQT